MGHLTLLVRLGSYFGLGTPLLVWLMSYFLGGLEEDKWDHEEIPDI